MPLLERFDTPAQYRDVPDGSEFYDRWSQSVSDTIGGLTSNPSGGGFYDPTKLDIQVVGEKAMTWMGLPRRRLLPDNRDNKRATYEDADIYDDRRHQDEYFEWRTERNANDKITRVTFVTEFRSYYRELWDIDPRLVVDLYRKILGTSAVKKTHLQDSSGAYDIRNRWNTKDGIVHYIHRINTLSAGVGLCKDGAGHDSVNQNNFEANPPYAKTTTSVDPRISYDVNMLVRKGLYVTLRDPIGFYIASWNNAGITKPNGRPAPSDWWQIKRGEPGLVQRLVYEVPASEGFVIGDLLLGGRPIEFGSQLAEHITVVIHGLAGTMARGSSNNVS